MKNHHLYFLVKDVPGIDTNDRLHTHNHGRKHPDRIEVTTERSPCGNSLAWDDSGVERRLFFFLAGARRSKLGFGVGSGYGERGGRSLV